MGPVQFIKLVNYPTVCIFILILIFFTFRDFKRLLSFLNAPRRVFIVNSWKRCSRFPCQIIQINYSIFDFIHNSFTRQTARLSPEYRTIWETFECFIWTLGKSIIIHVTDRSRSWLGDIRLRGGFELRCCLALSYLKVLKRFPNDNNTF